MYRKSFFFRSGEEIKYQFTDQGAKKRARKGKEGT